MNEFRRSIARGISRRIIKKMKTLNLRAGLGHALSAALVKSQAPARMELSRRYGLSKKRTFTLRRFKSTAKISKRSKRSFRIRQLHSAATST
jgi:hypothetical protein